MSLESLTILADIYNEAISHKKAVEMIKTGQCGQFNPYFDGMLLGNER